MRRDSKRGYLGGVCAGIAKALDLNVIGVRLTFVFFIPALIYIALWCTIKDCCQSNGTQCICTNKK